ncbi:MAG: protein-L-isoaspartate O-methyltransferase family protein [bacterium]
MLAPDSITARFNMVEQQIRPWDVSDDQVLELLDSLPREHFVPDEYAGLAYADVEIPLGFGETMLFPRIEAKILQELRIQPLDEILEIGTGSGYLTACLAEMGKHVTSYEQHSELVETARKNLDALNIDNILLENDNIFDVNVSYQRYDVIAVTGSMPDYKDEFQDLLKPGGRLFVVTGRGPAMEAMLYVKQENGMVAKEALFETAIPPLAAAPVSRTFVF